MYDIDLILSDYEPWLKKQAHVISPSGDQVEDLIQEGRIAIWKALDTYDPSRGELYPYLTTMAYFRMGNCLRKHRWTGYQKVSSPYVKRVPEQPMDMTELSTTSCYVVPGSADLSYHKSEIIGALKELTIKQQQYIVNRFWLQVPHRDNVNHGVWDVKTTGAKNRLKEKLKHLEGVA